MRQPVAGNMMKALYFQFTIGILPLYAIVFMGYWAYGNDTSAYLLNNVNGPVWVKAFVNMFAFLQSVITFHVSFFYLLTSPNSLSISLDAPLTVFPEW